MGSANLLVTVVRIVMGSAKLLVTVVRIVMGSANLLDNGSIVGGTK